MPISGRLVHRPGGAREAQSPRCLLRGGVSAGSAARSVRCAIGRRSHTVSAVLDAAGRRRSPATMPGYHACRAPRNKGQLYPADPPTVEEIIAVMRQTPDDRHGARLRALIVVLWRGGLRVREALALGERDLDPRRGSLLCAAARAAAGARSAWTPGRGSSCRPGLAPASSCRSDRRSASSPDRREAGPGRAPESASSSVGSPFRRV